MNPIYGWVWIPGTEWAPAWVVWRESPDFEYIGWAPYVPSGVVVVPSLFAFVEVHHFRDHLQPDRLIINNTTIINRTRVVNNMNQEKRTIGGRPQLIAVNRGPGVDPIQRVTGTRIGPRPIEQVMTQTSVPEELRQNRPPVASGVRSLQNQTAPAPVSRPLEQQPTRAATFHYRKGRAAYLS